jgi:polysaccharide biosynthesis/export protein
MKSRVAISVVLCVFLMTAPLWAAGEKIKPDVAAKPASEPAGEKAKPALPAKPAGEPVEAPGGYIIGPGDLLDVLVWKDETLTRSVYVMPDGRISFPLIGEVTAAGKTVYQVKKELEGKLGRYVPDAIISVDVKQVNSLLIYVIGRVNAPGRFVLNTNVNVLQALAVAGGLHPFAKKGKIKIFRHEGEKTSIFKFDYDDVSGGDHLEQNIQLKRGDVIVVP